MNSKKIFDEILKPEFKGNLDVLSKLTLNKKIVIQEARSDFIYNNYEEEVQNYDANTIYVDRIVRSILFDKPRIRLYEIMWDYSTAVKMIPENLNRMIGKIKKKKLWNTSKPITQAEQSLFNKHTMVNQISMLIL